MYQFILTCFNLWNPVTSSVKVTQLFELAHAQTKLDL